MKINDLVLRDGLLYTKERIMATDMFDMLKCRPLESLLSPLDIEYLHKIATSLRYSGNINLKYKKMDELMRKRNFVKFACGTNRRIYRYLDDDSFILKVAVDNVGIEDSPKEFINQEYLKPFVSKIFQVSPCGTVALCEKVDPVRTRDEFIEIAGDVFDMLYLTNILGRYVLEDIGNDAFMNYGIRKGFGPVILDYPYLYQVQSENDLMCHNMVHGRECRGQIKYDDGLNNLICEKCGKLYTGKQIGKPVYEIPKNQSIYNAIIEEECYNNKTSLSSISKDGVVLAEFSRNSDIIY